MSVAPAFECMMFPSVVLGLLCDEAIIGALAVPFDYRPRPKGDGETKAARAQHLGMHAYQTARPFHVLNHRRNDVDLPSAYKSVWQLGPDILYWSHVPGLLILRHAHIFIVVGTTTCFRNLETSTPRIHQDRDHHVSRNRLEPTEAPAVDLSAALRRNVEASIAPICWQAGCSSSPQVLATGTCLVARCPAACGGSTTTTTPTTTNTTNTLRLQLVQSPDGVVAATKVRTLPSHL